MAYDYETQKAVVFTPDGLKMILKIQATAKRLQRESGAFIMLKLIAGLTGDSWDMLACVDYLAEIGEIKLVHDPGVSQYRIYQGYIRSRDDQWGVIVWFVREPGEKALIEAEATKKA